MELFHVFNRGVEKRDIFLDDQDRFRFTHALGLFNTRKPANNTTYLLDASYNDFVNRYDDPLIDLHGWVLMKNHYHLLISEKIEGGITAFLRKLNVGYANYFNIRHEREGSLFQGRTKKVLIATDAHYLHILNYIHLNPLDFLSTARTWRDRSIGNTTEAIQHLQQYRWSSLSDYCGRSNFPSIITTEQFGKDPAHFERETFAYLSDMAETPTDFPRQYYLE